MSVTYPEKKERIYLLVGVDIWHDSKTSRSYAISSAKENVLAVATLGMSEPRTAKLNPKRPKESTP